MLHLLCLMLVFIWSIVSGLWGQQVNHLTTSLQIPWVPLQRKMNSKPQRPCLSWAFRTRLPLWAGGRTCRSLQSSFFLPLSTRLLWPIASSCFFRDPPKRSVSRLQRRYRACEGHWLTHIHRSTNNVELVSGELQLPKQASYNTVSYI